MRPDFGKIRRRAAYYSLTALIAISSLLSVSFFWRDPQFLAIVMLALATAMLALGFSKRLLLFMVVSAVAGTLAEMCGIYSGAWAYASSPAPYTPIWLLPLWGTAGVFLLRLREAMDEVFR